MQSVFRDCYIGYFYLLALGIVLGSITPDVGNEKTEDREGGRTSLTAGLWPRDGHLDPQLGFLQNCSLQPPNLICAALLAKDSVSWS